MALHINRMKSQLPHQRLSPYFGIVSLRFVRAISFAVILSYVILGSSASRAAPTRTAIGATVPLKGNLASYGHRIRAGIEVAQEELRKNGVEFELTIEDTPISGSGAITALRSLIDSRRVGGLAGNFSNVAMVSFAPILRRTNTLAMHTAAMDDEILAQSGGVVFSTNVRVRDEAFRAATHLIHEGARRVAVVTINTSFGMGYRRHFIDAFTKLGGVIVADESYELGETDYRSQIVRVKQGRPDAIYAATFGHFLGLTTKFIRTAGITAPIFSVYESEDPSVIQAGGDATEGLKYFVSYNSPTVESSTYQRLKEKLGHDPRSFSLFAYDATMLLATARNECQFDFECSKTKLLSTKNYNGLSGVFSIGTDGAADRPFYLHMIRDGRFVSAKP